VPGAIPIEPTVALALITSGVVLAFFLIAGVKLLCREVSKSDPNEHLR
jgi:hypothetical protein